jgi:hypothetical protein
MGTMAHPLPSLFSVLSVPSRKWSAMYGDGEVDVHVTDHIACTNHVLQSRCVCRHETYSDLQHVVRAWAFSLASEP